MRIKANSDGFFNKNFAHRQGIKPFKKSRTNTQIPQRRPTTLKTLVAPILPEPKFLISIPLIIVFLFYSYTYFIKHIFIVDLLIFCIAIIASQIISYRLILIDKKYLIINVLGGFIIIITLISFSLFSFFPPRLKLFKDYSSGEYEIIKK